MIGYLPVAVMFGISTRTAGLGVAEALAMSIFIFAGASQFALVGMLASCVSLPGALIATVGLNLRHLFYGPALAPFLGLTDWKRALPYVIRPRISPSGEEAFRNSAGFSMRCAARLQFSVFEKR
jgi:predicted branched-subunit amino acid permease